jgi:hypothetical protein
MIYDTRRDILTMMMMMGTEYVSLANNRVHSVAVLDVTSAGGSQRRL